MARRSSSIVAVAIIGSVTCSCGKVEREDTPLITAWTVTPPDACGGCPVQPTLYGLTTDATAREIAPSVFGAALSPDAHWLAFGKALYGTTIMSMQDGARHTFEPYVLANWSPNSDRFVAAAYNEMLIARNDGTEMLEGPHTFGEDFRWAPDDSVVVQIPSYRVTDSYSGETLTLPNEIAQSGSHVAFSPDGQWLATLYPHTDASSPPGKVVMVRLDGSELREIPLVDSSGAALPATISVQWSPDASALTTGVQSQTLLIQSATGAVSVAGQGGPSWWSPTIPEFAFLEDGTRLVVLSADGTARRYLADTMDRVFWSPDGHLLTYSTQDGCHLIRATDGHELLSNAWPACPLFGPKGWLAVSEASGRAWSFAHSTDPDNVTVTIETQRWEWIAFEQVAYLVNGTRLRLAALDGTRDVEVTWDGAKGEVAFVTRQPSLLY